MKAKDVIIGMFKTKKRMIISGIFALIVVCLILALTTCNYRADVDTEAFNQLLQEASDLTTAKLKLTAMSEYKDSGVVILNRADFIMVYSAEVRAGIDVKNIKVEADNINKVIHVSIPKATVQDAKVDPKNITYFDEDFALFNVDEKEDANEAVALAEEDIKKQAVKTGILEMADKQAIKLVTGLLTEAVPDGYTLDVKQVK